MLKQRDKRSSRSSSKGRKHRTGAYSKEDIRDQYCINQKELQAFEEFSKNKLWGCLSTGNLLNLNFASNLAHHQPPYLISGVGQAQKVQSKDANRTIARYADISDSETSSDYGCRNNALSLFTCMRKVRIPKHYQRPLDPKLLQQQSDDDFGFKRLPVRPPRTCTIKMNPNKTASSISVMMENQAPPQFPQPFPAAYHLHQDSIPRSVNLADYQGVLRANNNNPVAFLVSTRFGSLIRIALAQVETARLAALRRREQPIDYQVFQAENQSAVTKSFAIPINLSWSKP